MPPRVVPTSTAAASADVPGIISADDYRRLTGTPPTLPTAALSTTGLSTWTDVTVTSLTSPIDSAANQLKYRRSHNIGYAAAGKLVLTGLFPGLNSDDSMYDTTCMHRLTGYVEPTTGRALLAVAMTGPGRGTNGAVTYRRDPYAYDYMMSHAAVAVGANVWAGGRSRVLIGMSNGADDALRYAAHFPDKVAALVLIAPNWNMGYGVGSYYDRQSASGRTGIESQLAARGTSTSAQLDTYRVAYAVEAVRRLLRLPGWRAPIYILGDRTEAPTVPLPSPDLLASALTTELVNKSLVRKVITQSDSSFRVLHAGLPNNAGEIEGEKRWFPVLAEIEEYPMPQAVEAPGLQILGSICTRTISGSADPADDRMGLEIFLSSAVDGKTDSTNGGMTHVADFTYDNVSGLYVLDPTNSTNGYVQLIGGPEGLDDRSEAFTAGVRKRIELAVSPDITDVVTDTHYTLEWNAEDLVDGAVSSWTDTNAVGVSWVQATGSKQPTSAVDGNGHRYVEFDGVDDVLNVTNALWDPRADFAVTVVASKLDSAARVIIDLTRTGTLEESRIVWNTAWIGEYLDSANAESGGEVGGVGGINTISVVTYQRHGTKHQMSVDGSVIQEGTIGNEWGGISGAVASLGSARAGATNYLFGAWRIYRLAIKQTKAASMRDLRSIQRMYEAATS